MNAEALSMDAAIDFSSAKKRMQSYANRALARLRMQAALDALAVSLTVAAWLLVVLLLAEKLFSLRLLGINVWVIWAGLSILSLPYIIWRSFAPYLHAKRAAVVTDDRLALHARLSSALTLDFTDPANTEFGGAFLSEATHKMSNVRVQQAFPVKASRAFPWLAVPALLAAGAYLMKPQDVLGIESRMEAKRRAEERKAAAATTMESRLEDLKKITDQKAGDEKSGNYKVKELIKDAERIAKDLKQGDANAEQSLQGLVALKKQIDDEKEKVQRGKEFSDRLAKLQAKDLNLEESDMTKAISEALKMGDPGQAATEMRKLAKKVKEDILNDDSKTPEQKQKELAKLQNELEKLAGALMEDGAMRDKLQELSKESMGAAEFQKLEKAMKDQLEKQNKGNKKFGDEIQRQLAEAADELERLEEENDTKLDEDEQNEMNELDELGAGIDEAIDGLAGEECENGQCKGGQQPGGQQPGGKPKAGKGKAGGKQGQAGNKMKSMTGRAQRQRGQGQQEGPDGKQAGGQNGQGGNQGNQQGKPGDFQTGGGPGQGRRAYRDGDALFEKQKANGEMRAGAITGISHFRGQGAKGDAPKEFYDTFEAANKENASSLELERVPADAREMVKDYFTRVRNDAASGATPPPSAPVITPKAPSAPAPKNEAPAKEGLKE